MLQDYHQPHNSRTHAARIPRRFRGGCRAFLIVPRKVLGGAGYVAPNDKINVAIIGCGGQGLVDLGNLIKFPELQFVAVADPMEEWDYREFYFGGTAGRAAAKRIIEKKYAEDNQAALLQRLCGL